QFGMMFVPDKQKAVNEAFRVLKPGGTFIFATWDDINNNPVNVLANDVTNSFFTDNPITFWNIPFSMYNPDEMKGYMNNAGFKEVTADRIEIQHTVPGARVIAEGLTTGTPMYGAIFERDKERIPAIIDKVTAKIEEKYGKENVELQLSAW